MTMVAERFEVLEKTVRVVIQSPEMDDAERARFLTAFRHKTAIPWWVLPSWEAFSEKAWIWWVNGSAAPSLSG